MNKVKNTEREYFLLKTNEIKEELEYLSKEFKNNKYCLSSDASWDWKVVEISLIKANKLALNLQKSAKNLKTSLLGSFQIKRLHQILIKLISYKEDIKQAIISLKTLEEENFN